MVLLCLSLFYLVFHKVPFLAQLFSYSTLMTYLLFILILVAYCKPTIPLSLIYLNNQIIFMELEHDNRILIFCTTKVSYI